MPLPSVRSVSAPSAISVARRGILPVARHRERVTADPVEPVRRDSCLLEHDVAPGPDGQPGHALVVTERADELRRRRRCRTCR